MAKADLGAIETCGGLPSFSPLMDLRRALMARITRSACLVRGVESSEKEKRGLRSVEQ